MTASRPRFTPEPERTCRRPPIDPAADRAEVLRLLQAHGPQAGATIASRASFGAGRVTAALADLLRGGLVKKTTGAKLRWPARTAVVWFLPQSPPEPAPIGAKPPPGLAGR
jgi:hypothetical protein